MGIVHINRKGDSYYLHQGVTKKGNPKYYFSRRKEGTLVDALPEGYEIYENPNAQVFLRRILARMFSKEEISIVRNSVEKLSALKDFKIDIRKRAIVVFEPDQDLDLLSETISRYSWQDSLEIKRMLKPTVTYSPTMRFVLEDEKEREFRVERMCYVGPDPDWLFLDVGDVKNLAKKYCFHLGRESFYELI